MAGHPSGLVEDLHIEKRNEETLCSVTAWVQTHELAEVREIGRRTQLDLDTLQPLAASSNSLTRLDIGIADGCAFLSFS